LGAIIAVFVRISCVLIFSPHGVGEAELPLFSIVRVSMLIVRKRGFDFFSGWLRERKTEGCATAESGKTLRAVLGLPRRQCDLLKLAHELATAHSG